MIDSPPVNLVGTNKAQHLHRIPHSVLRRCLTIRCRHCRQDTLFMEGTLAQTRAACKAAGRYLFLICNQCERLAGTPDHLVEMFDPKLAEEMSKHYREQQ